MTVTEILTKLKSLGDEKVRKHNTKWGAHDNQFGVKMGDIRAIAKRLKTNTSLAKELWTTGNIEARLLATLTINPKDLSIAELDDMVRSERYTQVIDWLYSNVVKEHPDKEKLREQWLIADDIMAARLGWSLTSGKVVHSPESVDIPALLTRIEKEMPLAPAEVQWTMNSTLAQIGINHPVYRDRALEIGERLGVFRDYPTSKGCTSPFAPIWINAMVSRQNKSN